jgi:drug/metabolite transporter (DMT)-like permease
MFLMEKTVSRSKIMIAIELTVVMICFAANSVITRYLVLGNRFSPFALTVIRFVSGLAVLQVLASLMPGTFQRDEPRRSYFLGALFLGIYAFSISYGYFFITAAAGVLIFYTFVIATMTLFSIVIDREKLTLPLLFGQLLGIAGVLMISFGGIKSVTLTGVFLMAVTGISWGLHSVCSRKFKNPFAYTYTSFLIFGVISLLVSLLSYPWWGRQIWTNISSGNLGWALFMGTISTALSYALWYRVMKKIKASQGGVVQLLVPIFTGLMGVFILGEGITLSLVFGGCLVLSGIFLNTLSKTS